MTVKPIYTFILPARNNAATHSYEKQRKEWLTLALDNAGGYTDLGIVTGKWISDGRTFEDENFRIEVACSTAVATLLTREAFKLFPDQEAIAFQTDGTLRIITRYDFDHGAWPHPGHTNPKECEPEPGAFIVGEGERPNPRSFGSNLNAAMPIDPLTGLAAVEPIQGATDEALADDLRDIVSQLESVSWALDAALSAQRKDAAHYRQHNSANLDGGLNAKSGQLEWARSEAQKTLSILLAAGFVAS